MSALKSTVQDLHKVILTANEIVQNLNTATEKLNGSEGTVGVPLNNDEAEVSMKNTLANLKSGTKKLDESMEALQHNFLLRGFFRKRAKARETRTKDSLRMVVTQN